VTSTNIPVREIPDLFDRSNFAKQKDMEMTLSPILTKPAVAESSDNGGNLPDCIFTEKLRFGKYSGKSPGDVLMAEGDGAKDELKGAYKILKENLGKFPQNQTLMDAIKAAVSAYKSGELKQGDTPTVQSSSGGLTKFPLYKAEARALFRKKREDGLSPAHDCSINWVFGNENPIEVEVKNYFAPVIEKDNGTIRTQVSKKVEETTGRMYITAAEWADVIQKIKISMNAFEAVYGPGCYKLAEQAVLDNIEAAKGKND
jgi:hypothetical protein